ncbi:unnamed protein product [Cladocopium goreaui]|uniref:Uncharacterized protein n=1 Tax=Cladocopium goreaui TaxID=2562237 RepID=A0A9P1DLY7_9DINO|nr:unnamed protein product [Cladocopium goreaui]
MYVTQCVQTLQSVLTSSPKNAAHVQVPLPHAQTNAKAVVKHRRLLEDQLMNASLDVLWPVTLSFDKSQLSAGDKRAPWHPCLFVTASCHETSPWQDSHAAQTRTIGPCPLIRVADMLGFDETMRPGASARTGVPAHAAILTSYLRGLSFGDGDVVVVADVLPNRHAEFGRAALERMLDGSRATPQMYYVGCLRPDQGDVKIAMEKVVYDDWDRSPTAPARSRPVEPQPDPNLLLLTWSNNSASFPDSVLQKFPEGTTARAEILELKRAFIEERATGRPDFSIDGGAKPLDLARDLNLPLVASSDFSVQRKGYCASSRNKPAVVIGEDYSMWIGNETTKWIGNETTEELKLECSEICGFNLGAYEEKAVTGLGESELSGICFRFPNDLALVSHERKCMSLAEYSHICCTVHGVASFELANHLIVQKQYPPAEQGQEGLPVPYRFQVSPAANGKCNVFKPNVISSDSGAVRHATIGALYVGHMDKLPKTQSACTVWEA